MRVILKPGLIVVAPETAADRAAWAEWRHAVEGHVFHLSGGSEANGVLHDLGAREVACREPINIVYTKVAPQWRPISNLALTPFTMDGRQYASVEGFWQGLKFETEADRRRIASLWGGEAKKAGASATVGASFRYGGRECACGGPDHHRLMVLACRSKFSQSLEARDALLATDRRILMHRTRRDSPTIPGALMADIWMTLRTFLSRDAAAAGTPTGTTPLRS